MALRFFLFFEEGEAAGSAKSVLVAKRLSFFNN
jgi:hypothetical protein